MNISRKWALAALLGAAALVPGTAQADGSAPVPANIQADITKTQGDVQALHDAIVADANKIQADVQSLTGSTDLSSIAAALGADVKQLASDRQSGNSAIEADWQQLKSDWQAAHAANETKGQIAPLVKAMVSSNLALRADLQQAVRTARQAAAGLRQTVRQQHEQDRATKLGGGTNGGLGGGAANPGLAAASGAKSVSTG